MQQLAQPNGITRLAAEFLQLQQSSATLNTLASLDNKTYALNAQTGAFLWSYQTGGNIYSSPAVVNGVAYFGSYDGNVYAVGQNAGT